MTRSALALSLVVTVAAVAVPSRAEPASAAGADVVPSCAAPVTSGQFRCFALKRTGVRHGKPSGRPERPEGLGPADLRSAYRLPFSRTNATIAVVVAYDNPAAEADLQVYRSTYGLPPCTSANGCFRKVNQRGDAAPLPAPDPAWAGESSLDLDMVSAVCPSCRILLVEADDASLNLLEGVSTAVALGASYVSMSWGLPEQELELTVDPLFFSAPGVVFTAASGDSGAAGGPVYPASSAGVVAVGGTSLRRAWNWRGWTESAWSGSGGGCSAYIAKPAFQHRVRACATRATADVAAVGDPATGVAVYQTYGDVGWGIDGGTSAGAPIIAAVYALAGAAGGQGAPAGYPYAARRGLFDVTSGSTGTCTPRVLCTGSRGWDAPTGLGTPNGVSAFAPPR
ncbi:S53 family peptidase [Micromonospora robiginosa]|uniref:S53 family peptidase n=1 Tax=Micromonospora robiginosa TaxID=2749844 RepID=A0A7L6B469_9ACTN|nr:S53 family peptidase [Micromonospora ferruginea]QLQ36661.2 S53 family peptidase [Micromonospora ferruginea]